jgi:predicted kinase
MGRPVALLSWRQGAQIWVRFMGKLFIVCGLSFAGKSTLGRAIAERLGYEEVDVDRTKVALYGVDVQDEVLPRAAWNRIYEETDRQILTLLHAGKNVIDASRNFTRAERDHIRAMVDAFGYQTVAIHVTTPEAIARQRWQANRKNPSRRDVSDRDFADIIRAMEPPTADEHPLRFHSDDDIAQWIADHLQALT